MSILKKEDKSKNIFKAAESIIQSEGLDRLSMNKVASKSGLAKGTLYLYFKNKEEIIGEITIKARKLLLQVFKDFCDKTEDPIEKIKQIFWADYYFAENHRTYHELVTFYEKNTGLSEPQDLMDSSIAISEYLLYVLDYAKEHGAIREDVDTRATIFVLWGTIVGILQLLDSKETYIQDFTAKSKKEFYELFVNSTVKGLM